MNRYKIVDSEGRTVEVYADWALDAQEQYIDWCEKNELVHGNLKITKHR